MDFQMISKLMAGIALFLFGMNVFEEVIRNTFGSGIKDTIQKYAGSLGKTIGIGALATVILQSSLIVIMLMLGFVGAGILTLPQGLGIILGSNIGTTITPWLIALVGFKMDIEALTLPILALGGILLIVGTRNKKLKTTANLIIAFGLLFLGLGYMKSSVDILAASFTLADMNIGLVKSIIIGLVVTVVLQTSTGSTILALTALSSGMISFDIALGIVIGANMGSAVSTFLIGFLSSDKTQRMKRTLATTHLITNGIMMIIMILVLNPVYWMMKTIGLVDDPVIGIAFYHTFYNTVGVILLAPFMGRYARFLTKNGRISEQKDDTLFAIEQRDTDLPEEYISLMEVDIRRIVGDFNNYIGLLTNNTREHAESLVMEATDLQRKLEERLNLVVVYDPEDINDDQLNQLERFQLTISKYLNAIKQLKDISATYYFLSQDKTSFIQAYMERFHNKLNRLKEVTLLSVDRHISNSLPQKIDTMNQELNLDDQLFVRDLRESIVRHSRQNEEDHVWSNLIKINHSIILASKEALSACSYYSGIISNEEVSFITVG